MLADSHCHLDYFEESEIDVILQNCKNNGVGILHTISTEVKNIKKVTSFAKKHKNIVCSIGEHPCNISKSNIVRINDLTEQYSKFSDFIVSVGETGLDYYRPEQKNLKVEQIESLEHHIEFARQNSLPLVFHVRDSADDFADIASYQMKKKEFKGVMHCFSGSKEYLYRMLDLGFYISLSGIVTFKNAKLLHEIAKYIPKDRLMIETDSPYLAPEPMRGKRNEPSFVFYVARYLSEHLSISLDELSGLTTENFLNLFKLSYDGESLTKI